MLIKLKNTIRNLLKKTYITRLLFAHSSDRRFQKIRFISATRLSESDFWKKSALGQSFKPWRNDPDVSYQFYYENTRGLPELYNVEISRSDDTNVLVFLHDDVWLNDRDLLPKLRLALKRFDAIGVAGNRRRVPNQPAWAFTHVEEEKFIWDDAENLSGMVQHGKPGQQKGPGYGKCPAHCELVDGVFIAIRKDVVKTSGVSFDERFSFDFYDMDFCRSLRLAGLSLGTWPITLIHESGGAFNSPKWRSAFQRYIEKWQK